MDSHQIEILPAARQVWRFIITFLLGAAFFLDASATAVTPTIDGFRVVSFRRASVKIEVTYTYDGSQGPLYLGVKVKDGSDTGIATNTNPWPAASGKAQRMLVNFVVPADDARLRARKVEAYFRKENTVAVSRTFEWRYPDITEAMDRSGMLNDAVDLVDNVDQFGMPRYGFRPDYSAAKNMLAQIILEDPANVPAYLELARVAMKSDQDANEAENYRGLAEARRLIQVALKIDPNNANTYILFGYVLGIERRTDEAVSAFRKARAIGTNNMWLYYNWSLALRNAGRMPEAMAELQTGVGLMPIPPTFESRSDNQAIPMIFSSLHEMLTAKGDDQGVDALFQKRLAVLAEPCQYAYFAQFKLDKTTQVDEALSLANQGYRRGCEDAARPVLAAAYLTKWAGDKGSGNRMVQGQLLDKAQALISNSQQTILTIARSQAGPQVLPKLKAAGFDIDAPDAKGVTPLVMAAANGDVRAAQRLLAAGANPEKALPHGWSVLMVAVASRQPEVVALLLTHKVNYEQANAQGQNAMSIARELGDKRIIDLLNVQKRS